MNKKGFLLLDSLISIYIVSILSIFAISILIAIDNYEEGYTNYIKKANDRYEIAMSNIYYCNGCHLYDD